MIKLDSIASSSVFAWLCYMYVCIYLLFVNFLCVAAAFMANEDKYMY